MKRPMENIYALTDADSILSPALIYYADLIERNTRAAIAMAGGAERLWPHVKSHKTREMLEMQMDMGIKRFKCATLAELDMTASAGAEHALLAYPLVGPAVERFLDIACKYPDTRIYALGDSEGALAHLNAACAQRGMRIPVFIDVDMGMHRTGVPADMLPAFCRSLASFGALDMCGLHCYDGQNHHQDAAGRASAVAAQWAQVECAMERMRADGFGELMAICGGSPTFGCFAAFNNVFLSPGTVFLWDEGYRSSFPDMPFVPAGAVMTRVISHQPGGAFTLDLGYKAIASDPSGARGVIAGLPQAEPLFQNEEHWVWRVEDESARPDIGDVLYVIPTHICPTSALHSEAFAARGGHIEGAWRIAARDRLY